MFRFFTALLAGLYFFFLIPSLKAAEGEAGEVPFFPLLPLILAAEGGEVSWSPDWPVEIPPDAFTVLSGRPVSIVFSQDGAEYRLRRNSRLLLEEFPAVVEGKLVQVRTNLGPSGAIRGFTIAGEPERTLEFQTALSGEPSIVRFFDEERTYFIVGAWGTGGSAGNFADGYSETWYDEAGTVQAYFETALDMTGERPRIVSRIGASEKSESPERYHYDGFGNISGVESPGGSFSALYAAPLRPRYWERRPLAPPSDAEGEAEAAPPGPAETMSGRLSLQWDERGFLIRIAGEDAEDYRYEYTLDRRGNWTERRELRMAGHFGGLAAEPGIVARRVIEYGR